MFYRQVVNSSEKGVPFPQSCL